MYTFGVDLGGTNIKIGLVDSKNNILAKIILKTKAYKNKKGVIKAIVLTLNSLIKKYKLQKKDITGIGFALAGPIDIEKGVVRFLPNIKGWKNTPLKRIMEDKLNLPVAIDNDANLFALAEHKLGIGKGVNNLVLLTLGTGVGGGLILDGKLYRGRSAAAGEIGHIPVNIHGPKCNCGGAACLERYIGNVYIERYAAKIFGRKINLEELSLLAKKANKKAIKVWQEVGNYLGVVLSGIINLLNPGMIILSGGVAGAGRVLFSSIRKTVKKRAMAPHRNTVKIIKGKLGTDTGIIGASLLVKDTFSVRTKQRFNK